MRKRTKINVVLTQLNQLALGLVVRNVLWFVKVEGLSEWFYVRHRTVYDNKEITDLNKTCVPTGSSSKYSNKVVLLIVCLLTV